MENILKVLLQSVLAFIVLFIISKFLGKKQVAQLEFTDYVIGISIGSIAAEMACEPEIPYYHFIIAMVIFGLLDLFITLFSRKAKILKSFFKGRPIILIENGKINYKNLIKSKLDLNELIAQCRNKNYFYLDDIAFCIFETNGNFSILPVSKSRPVVAQDFKMANEKVVLVKELIVDGKINYKLLESLNKNKK